MTSSSDFSLMRSSPKIDPPASGGRPLVKIAAGLDAPYRPEAGFSRGSFFVGGAAWPGGAGTTFTLAASAAFGPAKNSGAERLWLEREVGTAAGSVGARLSAATGPFARPGPTSSDGT